MPRDFRRQSAGGSRTPVRHENTDGVIPQIAKAARDVEAAAHRGKVSPANRVKFQVAALLVREERQKAKEAEGLSPEERAEALKRLDGLAAILAKIAARDTSLISLLAPEAQVGDAARRLRKQILFAGGVEIVVDDLPKAESSAPVPAEIAERQVIPQSVRSHARAHPFQAPNLTPEKPAHMYRLSNWDLLPSLLKAFEVGAGGGSATMPLPEVPKYDRLAPAGLELMPHQARFLEAVREGHREFLLADEPGLGKTAQAVLAASLANAYPLLVVVPNVVKMNWAREVERWTPHRRATVIQGDGMDVDAFADVVIVNYEVLDRHLSWLRSLGFRGMVVDEAHFIKNLQSQRSRYVMATAKSIRERSGDEKPLMMALTGTPLINDVDDFRAIWQFLGWIENDRPTANLAAALDATGLTPADREFAAEARRAVIDQGIVRRRKVDVARDLPAKRVADMPVELDTEEGRSIRESERALTAKLLERYRRIAIAKGDDSRFVDRDRVRLVAHQELEESGGSTTGENVFSMLRRIGQAKAQLAADYTAQLAHSVGKVVFFAKHIDVMDQAEQTLRARGLGVRSIRGEQAAVARQEAIDAFNDDPDVSVIVCSLTAAGVGVNLQAASNVVLAELSWTAAEQTQAIDRVHRIGQDEPVTAWRILATQTIDTRIAEIIDRKQGLAARALDGDESVEAQVSSVQQQALESILTDALVAEGYVPPLAAA